MYKRPTPTEVSHISLKLDSNTEKLRQINEQIHKIEANINRILCRESNTFDATIMQQSRTVESSAASMPATTFVASPITRSVPLNLSATMPLTVPLNVASTMSLNVSSAMLPNVPLDVASSTAPVVSQTVLPSVSAAIPSTTSASVSSTISQTVLPTFSTSIPPTISTALPTNIPSLAPAADHSGTGRENAPTHEEALSYIDFYTIGKAEDNITKAFVNTLLNGYLLKRRTLSETDKSRFIHAVLEDYYGNPRHIPFTNHVVDWNVVQRCIDEVNAYDLARRNIFYFWWFKIVNGFRWFFGLRQ